MDLVATHQRCLIGSVMRTSGPILELGTGWYSTPLLHEIATVQQRPLITLDNNKHWLEQFKATDWKKKSTIYGLGNDYHQLRLVDWWDQALLAPQDYGLKHTSWSVVFVDHGPPIERYYVVNRMLEEIKRGIYEEPSVFVLHDTEDRHPYGYSRILPKFKYEFTDRCQKAHTTVCSNSLEVHNWFRNLPPVDEPVKEVT